MSVYKTCSRLLTNQLHRREAAVNSTLKLQAQHYSLCLILFIIHIYYTLSYFNKKDTQELKHQVGFPRRVFQGEVQVRVLTIKY